MDCVITLTLVLFSFTGKGSLWSAMVPKDLPAGQAIAINLLDLFILAVIRVFSVSINLLVP